MQPVAWGAMLVVLGTGPLHAQASEILGTWRGTSTCVKEAWNSACHDEQVIYSITRAPNQPDSVSVDAQKVVNGVAESMGILTLGPDSTGKTWSGEWSNARYHLLWSFELSGKTLTGTLLLLPERRVGRHIALKKY